MENFVASHSITRRTVETLEVKAIPGAPGTGEANARLRRQLLFMARLTHPATTLEDIFISEREDGPYHTVIVGTRSSGTNYLGATHYVEDLVE